MPRLLPFVSLFLAACAGSPKSADTAGQTGGLSTADADGDGFDASEDCNDADATVNPGAEEWCNGIDDNCDGSVDEGVLEEFFVDADGDGHGDPDQPVAACALPDGHASAPTDCDDSDAAVSPDAAEVCNTRDDNCDGSVDEGVTLEFWADEDGDGYGDPAAPQAACSLPDGAADNDQDCDDSAATVHPAAAEVCNERDDNCDGLTDEGTTTTFYEDRDADGFGRLDSTTDACELPTGYAATGGDCDDETPAVNPAAAEACNSIDDDCDGLVDDLDTDAPVVGATTFYADTDADGHGDPAAAVDACLAPTGHVADATDCDDSAAAVNPAAAEVCNAIDDDCDALIDDADPSISGQPTWYIDYDSDGYGATVLQQDACTQPSGYVADATDCEDTDAAVNPGAAEICNDLDDDCDGAVDQDDPDGPAAHTYYADLDGDSYGDPGSTVTDCAAPTGHVTDATDCEDGDAAIHPGAAELCNGVDDDCDTLIDSADPDGPTTSTWYADDDGDGYGDAGAPTTDCAQPSDHVSDATDCDDAVATVFPGATETCNDTDDDCDGSTDEGLIGMSASCAADSCADILDLWPAAPDGSYQLDPLGTGASTYACDMTTDGGGWTQLVDWNRVDDGDSKADFLAAFTVRKNNMGTFKEQTTALHWRDEDAAGRASADVLSLQVDVDVPNDGEVRYDVDHEGTSMEESAAYLWVETATADVELECWTGVSSWSPYSTAEQAERPGFTCTNTIASTGGRNFSWSGPTQDDAGAEIAALRFASFHYDSCCDYSYMYAFDFWVR